MTLSNLKQSISRRRLLFEASFLKFEYLWSKYYPFLCDGNIRNKHVFDNTERLLTSEQWQNCYDPGGRTFWVKLGSYRNGHPNNLSGFVEHILPKISQPFTLITTDGDSSVPSDLNDDVVQKLLGHPSLLAWYTQNLADNFHPKLHSVPIGLDFHTDRGFGVGIKLQRTFSAIAEQPPEPRLDRVLVDFSASSNSEVRKEFIAANSNNKFVDVLTSRVPQPELWKMYRRYRWVVSMPGNGLDCHRSWEAGYLGANVLVQKDVLPSLHKQKFITQIDPSIILNESDLPEVHIHNVSHNELVSHLQAQFVRPIEALQARK